MAAVIGVQVALAHNRLGGVLTGRCRPPIEGPAGHAELPAMYQGSASWTAESDHCPNGGLTLWEDWGKQVPDDRRR